MHCSWNPRSVYCSVTEFNILGSLISYFRIFFFLAFPLQYIILFLPVRAFLALLHIANHWVSVRQEKKPIVVLISVITLCDIIADSYVHVPLPVRFRTAVLLIAALKFLEYIICFPVSTSCCHEFVAVWKKFLRKAKETFQYFRIYKFLR